MQQSKMDGIKCTIATMVLISLLSNVWCQCTCITTPQTYEYINLDRGRQISRILHHSVCMVVTEPVVMDTPFDLRTDFTADPCCCKAFWRHVPSLGRGNVLFVKTVYHCETVLCSNHD